MEWKKNILSHIIWFAYVLLACAALLGQVAHLDGIEVEAAIGALAAAGASAVLFHLLAREKRNVEESGVNINVLVEATLVVLLLIVGLVLRIQRLPDAGEQVMYFEAAKVTEGQTIPQIVHGATYVYLMLLRGFFLLFGNKMSAGIWLQIVIQLFAILLLFIGIRKLAGTLAALFVLFFFTCSEFAVQDALLLSPRILFLFLFALGLAALSACKTKRIYPFLYLPCGVLVGAIVCLDAGGILLMLFGAAAVFSEWDQKPSGLRRAGALLLFLTGSLAGFWGFLYTGAVLGQSSFVEIVRAWLRLYQPGAFHIFLSIGDGISPWEILLVMLSLIGIISYWWDRHHERMSMWVVAASVAAVAECYGLLTEEMPASIYLLLSFSVLAGVSVQQCFRKESESVMPYAVMDREKNDSDIQKMQLAGESREPGEEEKPKPETWEPEDVKEPEQGTKEVEKLRLIENPLPLPKPHKKKVLDFDKIPAAGEEDFDLEVEENDDYDIK